MRDERLRWGPLTDFQRDVTTKARAICEKARANDALMGAIDAWLLSTGWDGLTEKGNARRGAAPLLRDTVAPHATAELDELPDALVQLIAASPAPAWEWHPEILAARLLLAERAAFVVARAEPSLVAFDAAAAFVHDRAETETFYECLASSLSRPQAGQWVELLRVIPESLEACARIERMDRIPLESIVEQERIDRARGAGAYLWGWREEPTLVRENLQARLLALSALSIQAFAEVLDVLPSRGLRNWLFRARHVVEDRAAILAGLQVSPAVYRDGCWTGNTVGVLFAEEAVDHAIAIRGAALTALRLNIDRAKQPELEKRLDATSNENKGWLIEAFATLLQREDGLHVALGIGACVVRRASREPREEAFEPLRTAMESLADSVAHSRFAGEIASGPWKWFASANGTLGVPPASGNVAVFAALVEHERSRLGALPTPRAAWSWYVELLQQYDDILVNQVRGDPAPRWLFACIASAGATEVVGDTWLEAWRVLRQQRELARFEPANAVARLPSEHLWRVGLAMLTLQPLAVDGRALWSELLRAGTTLMFETTKPRLDRDLVAHLFAVAPRVFGESLGHAVAEAAPLLRTEAELVLTAAAHLLKNGTPMSTVEALLSAQDCKPATAATDLNAWLGLLAVDADEQQREWLALFLPH